ncbi:hypothetical protein HDU92_005013 [Lobulomyces angularis]|nr:hypothetical protein HDU92_005013 [Lobulomyces angularis]
MEKMRQRSRSLSERVSRLGSPTKETPLYFESEKKCNPIRFQLGDYSLTYEDQTWKNDEYLNLEEKMKGLEVENQLLKFKLQVLIDMLAGTRLDLIEFQAQKV